MKWKRLWCTWNEETLSSPNWNISAHPHVLALFQHCDSLLSLCPVLRRRACRASVTGASAWLNTPVQLSASSSQNRALKSNPKHWRCVRGLTRRAAPRLSPASMNYTCLASHLPRSSLCNASHAWRIVCMCECLCGCIYSETGTEGRVTHSLSSVFLPPLSTHPPTHRLLLGENVEN